MSDESGPAVGDWSLEGDRKAFCSESSESIEILGLLQVDSLNPNT